MVKVDTFLRRSRRYVTIDCTVIQYVDIVQLHAERHMTVPEDEVSSN